MTVEYKGQKFITDDDLKVNVIGFWPRIDINNSELKEEFKLKYGRDFLGGDEIVSYAQSLVSRGMDFASLEEEILADMKNPEKGDIDDLIFKKTATGIGRGHSLGGLSGIVFGIHGTKMIDSGLTGFVSSRSLVTSNRRRESTTDEIVIPMRIYHKKELLDEYLKISRDVFNASNEFKSKFGKLKGIETFNKITPYNSPADLFIVMPLDTLATLTFEVNNDENRNFLPRELVDLSKKFSDITKEFGIGIMYNQRVQVPRDTYLHYTIFKDPLPNYALELAGSAGMSLEPLVLEVAKINSGGFDRGLRNLKNIFDETKRAKDPKKLAMMSMKSMLALREFVNEYNEAVRIKIIDSLSWRVWSEQKRHSTLRQNVESVYSAAYMSYLTIKEMWPSMQTAYKSGTLLNLDIDKIEKVIVIDDKLKNHPELLLPYLYHTSEQLMFYGKLLENKIEQRDALYIVPRNIRLRTLENYDLINLIDLELPLRLCYECEPERYSTSWKKRDAIAEATKSIPNLKYFLEPKCNIGFCTEENFCSHITDLRDYDKELHKSTKQAMLTGKY